jgi:hypothetical protein
MAVTGCTVRTGSGYNAYTGCKVHYRTHMFSYGMYANFTITPALRPDRLAVRVLPGVRHRPQSRLPHDDADQHRRGPGRPGHGQLSIRYNILPSGGQINKGACA